MIVLAREARGLTMQELADKINYTKGNLSLVERGKIGITKELIQSISKALNYSIDFFKQGDPVLELDNYFYRKQVKVPKKELKKSEAEVNITKINIEKLLLTVEPPLPNYPRFILGRNSAEDAARYVKQFWKVHGRIDNLTKLIEDNGILVVPLNFGELNIDGLSIVTEKNTPIIFYNKTIPSDRRRLTIAHELGHIIMHIGQEVAEERDIEKEAFAFAAELLMPEDEIKHSLSKVTIETLKQLKKEWKVSMAALIVRAKELGSISDEEYKELWKEMARNGYRKQEPEELNLSMEEPSLLKQILNLFIHEFTYTEKQLAAFLCYTDHIEFLNKYIDQKPGRLKVVRGGS